jgi:thiol-disulfide isomerase/thioredoxin
LIINNLKVPKASTMTNTNPNTNTPRHSRLTLLAAATAAILAMGLLTWRAQQIEYLPAAVAGETVEEPAPAIELESLDGKKYSLAKDPAKVVVLDFWATWCGPCIKGLPKLQETADWVKKEKLDVNIQTVNLEETPTEILSFWTQRGFTMPVLLDRQGTVATAYKAPPIPNTVIIVNGKIVNRFIGYSPKMETELRAAIKEALKKAEAAEKDAPKTKS